MNQSNQMMIESTNRSEMRANAAGIVLIKRCNRIRKNGALNDQVSNAASSQMKRTDAKSQ